MTLKTFNDMKLSSDPYICRGCSALHCTPKVSVSDWLIILMDPCNAGVFTLARDRDWLNNLHTCLDVVRLSSRGPHWLQVDPL
jgi:hypothetical protein